jgi:hypothetical protein
MRTILLCLIALILFVSPAFAQTASVDSAFTITLPDDMKAAEITDEDRADGLLLDMQNDSMRAVAYVYEPDPAYTPTLDEMYQNYLADQQEGFYTNVAIEDVNGTRMIVYDIDAGTVGALAVTQNGYTYEFIMICKADDAQDAAKAAIESIKAVA